VVFCKQEETATNAAEPRTFAFQPESSAVSHPQPESLLIPICANFDAFDSLGMNLVPSSLVNYKDLHFHFRVGSEQTGQVTMRYDHTQSGPLYLLLLAFSILILVFAFVMGEIVLQTILSCSGALMLLFAFSFHHLTVSDEGTELLIAFGPLPLFRRRLQYSELEKVERAKSTLLDGLGIHLSPSGGWVWNIWGYECVDVWYRQGRKVRIGTDDPEGLEQFLNQKIQQNND